MQEWVESYTFILLWTETVNGNEADFSGIFFRSLYFIFQ